MTSPASCVVVHAGFHKTGTSSLQHYLRTHRDRFADHFAYYGKRDFREVAALSRRYGMRPHPLAMRRFRLALRQYLASLPDHPRIVLSWEGFSGVMPGHRRLFSGRVTNFTRAGIPLGRCITSELRRRFGADRAVIFHYTLRERDDWLRSVHGHLLRSIRVVEEVERFRAGFPALRSLEDEAVAITRALDDVALSVSWLEETGVRREGPAAALLDLLDAPATLRADLPPAPRRNRADAEAVKDEMMEMNRRIADAAELRKRKKALTRAGREAAQ